MLEYADYAPQFGLLALGDLVRAWLQKDLKVSYLQATPE